MNEKKLTDEEIELNDEEIVEILEECFFGDVMKCCNCKLHNGKGLSSCMKNVARPTVDLIHRLQDENAEGKARIKELTSIAEYQQHSNIERWGIIQEKDKEIERLTEEKKTAWRKFKQKVDESIELSMLLEKRARERAELQKQVEKLKKKTSIWIWWQNKPLPITKIHKCKWTS